MFRIGSLVKYDGTGVPAMARVQGFDGRRVRIAVLPDGLHLTVPPGDLSLPTERVSWSPGDAPPGAIGIDYSNPDHHRALVAHIYSEKDRDTGET